MAQRSSTSPASTLRRCGRKTCGKNHANRYDLRGPRTRTGGVPALSFPAYTAPAWDQLESILGDENAFAWSPDIRSYCNTSDLAFEAIRKVLTDPKSSPSVLLRAATLIIDKITTPPQYREEKPADIAGMLAAMDAADRMHLAQQHQADRQECTTAPNEPNVFSMHNSAQPQEPCRRPEPKIGRNDACPCGSGKKYRQCCLNKSAAASA